MAAQEGQEDIVKLLLKSGADKEAQDNVRILLLLLLCIFLIYCYVLSHLATPFIPSMILSSSISFLIFIVYFDNYFSSTLPPSYPLSDLSLFSLPSSLSLLLHPSLPLTLLPSLSITLPPYLSITLPPSTPPSLSPFSTLFFTISSLRYFLHQCGWTPLLRASWKGHSHIVNILLDSEVDIEKANSVSTYTLSCYSCTSFPTPYLLQSISLELCMYHVTEYRTTSSRNVSRRDLSSSHLLQSSSPLLSQHIMLYLTITRVEGLHGPDQGGHRRPLGHREEAA